MGRASNALAWRCSVGGRSSRVCASSLSTSVGSAPSAAPLPSARSWAAARLSSATSTGVPGSLSGSSAPGSAAPGSAGAAAGAAAYGVEAATDAVASVLPRATTATVQATRAVREGRRRMGALYGRGPRPSARHAVPEIFSIRAVVEMAGVRVR